MDSGEPQPSWDFFVTYAPDDLPWAEWTAWQLEEAGYQVLVEAWDGVPGSYRAAVADAGVAHAAWVIALVSPAYGRPGRHQAARLAALDRDAGAARGTLLPVRIEACDPRGLLGAVEPIDLAGCDQPAASARLLGLVRAALAGRAKPAAAPDFPGLRPATQPRPPAPPGFPAPAGPPGATRRDELDEICAALAADLRLQVQAEARRKGYNALDLLPVTWAPAAPALFEDWSFLVDRVLHREPGLRPPTPETWAAGPAELAGGPRLDGTLRQVPTRRLVVLGAAGSGKSTLLYRLRRDLAESWNPAAAVPVLLPVASWTPDQDRPTFRRWIVDTIGALPALRRHGRQAARDLLDGHRLLLLLDGLDEIPPALRGQAIGEISRELDTGQEFVLAARTQEYRDAVSPLRNDDEEVQLAGSAGVELRPLDPPTVERYLRAASPGPRMARRWAPVRLALAETPAHPAARALTSPLALTLAVQIYTARPGDGGRRPDPGELLRLGFTDADAVLRHLIGELVAAEYPPGRRGWTRDRAYGWLRFLAGHQESQGGAPDLAWWRLAAQASGGTRYLLLLAAGALPWTVIATGLLTVLSLRGGPHVPHPGWDLLVFLAGLLGWCAGVFLFAFTNLAGGAGLAHWGARAPAARIGWTWAPRDARGRLRDRTAAGSGAVAIFAAVAAILGRNADARALGLGEAVGTCAVLGAAAAGAVGLLARVTTVPAAAGGPGGPARTRAADRRWFAALAVLFCAGAGASLAGIVTAVLSLTGAVSGAEAVEGGLLLGIGYGLPYGVARAAALTAWLPYTVTRLWLAGRGDLPWRVSRFLDGARDREILRQAGAAHQFRHIELQRQLGGDLPDPAAARLAERVAARVRGRAAQPSPRLGWQPADAALGTPWPLLRRLADGWNARGSSAWAHGPDGLAGSGTSLAGTFAKVPTGRLVVLGGEGSGRTTLLAGLALDLLADRSPSAPVPVPVSLRSWDPARRDLAAWLELELGRRDAWLASTTALVSGAAALLARRKVLPLLDGLEDIPPQLRGLALARIAAWLADGQPLVLTCDPDAWRAALRPGAGRPPDPPAAGGAGRRGARRWLTARRRPGAAQTGADAPGPGGPDDVLARLGVAAVELCPVGAADAAAYLAAHPAGDRTAAECWQPLLDQAAARPDGPVAAAVGSPLTLGLLAAAAGGAPADRAGGRPAGGCLAAQLCDGRRFPTAAAIRGELLAWWLDRSLAPAGEARAAGGRRRALGYLAWHLERRPADSLGWWEIQGAVPGAVIMTVAGVWGVAAELAYVALAGSPVIGYAGALVLFAMLLRQSRRISSLPGIAPAHAPRIRDYAGRGSTARWRPGGPRAVLRRCRRHACTVVPAVHAVVLPSLALYWQAIGLAPVPWPREAALTAAAALSAPFALTAWGRYQVARRWLAARRGLPADLLGGLDEATARGVVRQSGDVWEFSHPVVRRALAAEYAGDAAPGQLQDVWGHTRSDAAAV